MKAATLALIGLFSSTLSARADVVTVFAAASLKEAMDDMGAVWAQSSDHSLRLVYGASSAMARQIDQGAPADVYISANFEWVTWLQDRGALSGPAADIASNSLVLVGAADADPLDLSADAIAGALGENRLAIALPQAVPAGIYAKQALTALDAWAGVADQLAQTPNVRAALTLVARQETPLGIVYKTDALATPAVSIVAEFDARAHDDIRYVAAPISGTAASAEFLTWLGTPSAQSVLHRYGFKGPMMHNE